MGQQPIEPKASPGALDKAVETWLVSDQNDQELLSKTIAAVLDAKSGLPWLAAQLNAAKDPADRRTKGLRALVTHTSLEFLKRQKQSDMVFAGQYEPLRPLQPLVTNLFLDWLFATPDWYPDTHRVDLVPALRDLLPNPPEATVISGCIDIVKKEIEPTDLRRAVSYALYQWGRKEFVQPELEQWRAATAEGDAEDRLEALRKLADVYYQLREYRQAVTVHKQLQALGASSKLPLKPSDQYSAACTYALTGDVDAAFAALDRLADLQLSQSVDSSLKFKRSVFESDRDLARLRTDERFQKFMVKVFGESPTVEKPKDC